MSTNPSSKASSEGSSNYQYIFKVILIGDSSTGKTSLINRFVNRIFDDKYLCTIGVDFFMKTLNIDDNTVKLQIWDTAGMEKYKSISSSYYRGSHCAFVVYDITNRSSFENVSKWLEAYYKSSNPQFKKNILLIGNKLDLDDKREVPRTEAESFAQMHQMIYWETSAKEGSNVDEVFQYVGKYLFDNFKEESNTMGSDKKEIKQNNNFTTIISGKNKKDNCC